MGTLMKIAATAALALALAGCGGGAAVDQLAFCDAAEPLRPAPGETATLSPSLVGQIHEHNETGAAACGWSP